MFFRVPQCGKTLLAVDILVPFPEKAVQHFPNKVSEQIEC